MKNDNNKDELSRLWSMLSQMLPPIGFFLYYKHRKPFPNKAKKALRNALIGLPIAIILGYVFNNYIVK
ncbi:hypothetical protein [Pedobacter chinensis]|uniref:hypothetical protein n=1 Tax=Pedobacter chinensis TaxID=2282421 RepID=UPI0011C03BAE|nr:hypothetical protein [Pedobacter chinensis]